MKIYGFRVRVVCMPKNGYLWAVLILSSGVYAATIQNFQGGTGQTPYTLTQYGGTPAAGIVSGALRMVNTTSQNNVIAFDQTDTGLYSRIVAEWDLNIVQGADGLGFALLNTASYGVSGAGPSIGEEPSLGASFAVGFDIYCPDDYQGLGSREISLHWAGVERANKWSSFDYRTGTFNRVRVVVDFVAGGAEITVSIAGNVIYDKYFLAGMTPYNSRVAFGARTGGLSTTLLIDNISVAYELPTQAPPPPLTIRTFDQQLMNINHQNVVHTYSFLPNDTVYERVILRLKVEQPTGGWDPWDRMMGIYLWDANNQNRRYEIARFITPYSKAGTWWVDVTDYQSLFRGSRQMGIWLETWSGSDSPPVGYWITTDIDFYEGRPLYRVVGLRNLWVGTATYGTLADPTMSSFFTNMNVSVPNNADKAKLRFMVTGHGQSPNSENAAEFLVRGRTAKVNSQTFYNVLWRNDCYLNPCRPQSGTWQYSRAGWAPGDRVWPWDIDISPYITPGQSSTFGYVADAYYNYTPDSGNTARHWVESQVIFYEHLLMSDLNGDGAVDFKDFAMIAAKWKATVPGGDPADFMPLGYGDGVVNWQEIAQLASEWLIGK
ncbi:MAG: peptide-N-glycosidase F-related protein [Planctomycetota bacterium]|nr:peptide-N-glycosidase F-related protein [Planctomycetota bacterium]